MRKDDIIRAVNNADIDDLSDFKDEVIGQKDFKDAVSKKSGAIFPNIRRHGSARPLASLYRREINLDRLVFKNIFNRAFKQARDFKG